MPVINITQELFCLTLHFYSKNPNVQIILLRCHNFIKFYLHLFELLLFVCTGLEVSAALFCVITQELFFQVQNDEKNELGDIKLEEND